MTWLICAILGVHFHASGGQEASCTWPSCTPKCLPCQHGILGKCAWTALNLGQSCPTDAGGQVDCHLGSCFCGAGFCPKGFAHSSSRSLAAGNESEPVFKAEIASRCEPQVCTQGVGPPEHDQSMWAIFFSLFCGFQHVPKEVVAKMVNGSMSEALFASDHAWFSMSLLFPVVLLLCVGVAISLEMLIRIECHTSGKVKEIMAGHMRVEATQVGADGNAERFYLLDITDEAKTLHVTYAERNDLQERMRKIRAGCGNYVNKKGVAMEGTEEDWVHTIFDKESKMVANIPEDPEPFPISVVFTPADCELQIEKPSSIPMCLLAILTIALAFTLVMFLAYRDMQTTLDIIDRSMDRAHADAVIAAKQGQTIDQTARGFNSSLTMIETTCQKSLLMSPFLYDFENSTGPVVSSYMGMAADIGRKLTAGPTMIAEIHTSFNEHRAVLNWAPLLPVTLISILCVGMVIEAIVVEWFDSSTIAFEIDFTLRVATVLFALVIVILSVIGATELFVANFLSLLCQDVDDNILHAVEARAGSAGELHNLTLHYIKGVGYNPLEQTLHSADQMIYDIVMEYDSINKIVGFLGKLAACDLTKFLHVNQLAGGARELLNAVTPLVDNSHVYPYYEEAIRKGMCGSFIDALGWLWVAQLIVGLVSFPLCVYFTHMFLTKWAIWEWAKEHAVNSGHELMKFDSFESASMLSATDSSYTYLEELEELEDVESAIK